MLKNLKHTLHFCCRLHCNENPIYIFHFWELRGLSPNFHIHVSVSDLYIPMIVPHISSSRIGRPIVGIYKSLTDTWRWKLGLRPQYSFSGNICFKIFVLCLYSVFKNVTAHCVDTSEWNKALCSTDKLRHWPESLQGAAKASVVYIDRLGPCVVDFPKAAKTSVVWTSPGAAQASVL